MLGFSSSFSILKWKGLETTPPADIELPYVFQLKNEFFVFVFFLNLDLIEITCERNSYFNYCGCPCVVVYEKDIRPVVINGLVGEYRSIPVKDDVGFL